MTGTVPKVRNWLGKPRIPTINYRLYPFRLIFLTVIFLLDHHAEKGNKFVNGQAITPMLDRSEGGSETVPFLRSFLEPCEVVTLQTQCTEEEYESNEDCLPQKKDNCDHSKDLFCLDGVCLPNCHPHKETYDVIEGKCFRKVDSDCRSSNANNSSATQLSPFPEDNNNSTTSHENPQSGQPTSTVIVPECVKNAVCERGQCRCVNNFIYDPVFGKCMLYANYASYCNDTIVCDKISDISCIENQCACTSPQLQYYHLKRKRCYTLVGQVCSTGLQFCPDNSNCMRRKNNDTEINRAISSSNEEGGLVFTPLTSHPSQRSDSTPLVEDLHSRLRVLFEEKLSGRYGVDDDAEEEHFIGILGVDEGGTEFVCKCDKGYGSTRDKRFCLGLHGTRCNTLHRCNSERGLKCMDGVCLCGREKGNEQIFSEQFQTCITRTGTSCVEDGDGEKEPDICPIGGACKQGSCVCEQSLTATPTWSYLSKTSIAYSCRRSFGESCKTSSSEQSSSVSLLPEGIDPFEPPCNEEIGLECNTKERKCLCRDINQFYDTRMKACRNLLGVDTKIPVIHFTPPEDREYNFRKNSGKSNGTLAGSSSRGILLLVYAILLMVFSTFIESFHRL